MQVDLREMRVLNALECQGDGLLVIKDGLKI
jgi:hypothetical protein